MIRLGCLLVAEMFFALTVLACRSTLPPTPSGGQEGQPSPLTTALDQWNLSFQQEGGFAGLERTAMISSTGQAVFRDTRSGKEIKTTLTPDETRRLSDLIVARDLFEQKEDQRTPACRDCIIYRLDVQLGGHSRRIVADDQGLAETLRPLIEWLVERTNQALRP